MEKFKMPKDLWLKFGCFLSGHNYSILNECSEASKRDQKKITSALIIITIIWSIIGFIFSQKYLNTGLIGSLCGSLVMAIIIVQIERQIILTTDLKKLGTVFRILLGVIVATIGATIIDQHLFSQDIMNIAKNNVSTEADERLAKDKAILRKNEVEIDSQILAYKQEYITVSTKISKTPLTIDGGGGNRTYSPDGKILSQQSNLKQANPEIANLRNLQISINSRIQNLENEKLNNNKSGLLALEKKRQEILNEPPGFLKELNALIDYLIKYPVALGFYIIWFAFFLLIECLVLIIKSSHTQNDYEKIVAYQQKIREQRLMALEDKRNAALGSDQNIDATNSLITNTPK